MWQVRYIFTAAVVFLRAIDGGVSWGSAMNRGIVGGGENCGLWSYRIVSAIAFVTLTGAYIRTSVAVTFILTFCCISLYRNITLVKPGKIDARKRYGKS